MILWRRKIPVLFHTLWPYSLPDEDSYLSVVGSKDVLCCFWGCCLGKIIRHISWELLIWAVSLLWGTRPTVGWKWQVLGQLKLSAFKFCLFAHTYTCAHTHTNSLGMLNNSRFIFYCKLKCLTLPRGLAEPSKPVPSYHRLQHLAQA